MTLLILYIVLAIGVSFLCSVLEAVLLSLTPAHLATMKARGDRSAPILERWKANIDEPLAAILTLNTIAHTVGAAGAGAQAAHVFGDEWLGVFSGVLTLLILVASEIIPKTIGAVFWKQLVTPTVSVLRVIIWPMKPFVVFSSWMRKRIAGDHDGAQVSRAELRALATLGAEQGVIDEDESRILRSLLRFRSLKASDVMTPRTVMFSIPVDMTAGDALEAAGPVKFSRIPVYAETVDDLGGYVLRHDLLEHTARDADATPLSELVRSVLHVPESKPLSELLEGFLAAREHIAIVVDEYGGTAGLVTLEDVVETLLDTEILDESDTTADLQEAARASWRARARRLGILDEADAEV